MTWKVNAPNFSHLYFMLLFDCMPISTCLVNALSKGEIFYKGQDFSTLTNGSKLRRLFSNVPSY
jgi:hypothetical protein